MTQNYHLGEPFIITLYENASTGYQWSVRENPNLEILDVKTWTKCQPGVVGCGGYESWILIGTKRGPTKFEAKYSRPWEHDLKDVSYKTIDINII